MIVQAVVVATTTTKIKNKTALWKQLKQQRMTMRMNELGQESQEPSVMMIYNNISRHNQT